MIFIDTSAIYALLDSDDQNHPSASKTWTLLIESDTPLFTTNYVVLESISLLQRRLGLDAVRVFTADILPSIEILWITEPLHNQALSHLLDSSRRKLSLVDCTSFTALASARTTTAFAFDQHFTEAGYLPPTP